MIEVKNHYKATLEDKIYGVDIGRGSPFGNPFKMNNRSEEERIRVCEAFRVFLHHLLSDHPNHKLLKALDILYQRWQKEGKLVLLCYCAPKKCHGDTIKNYLLWKKTQDSED